MPKLSNPQYVEALTVARRLRERGFAAYFAGGCVRDMLLGVNPKDFDVATSATPEKVQQTFARTESVGAHFGVVLVLADVEGERIATEVATFRHDGAYSDGRRPDAVRFSSDPREDVLRRDFTINGLLLDALAFDQGDRLEDCVLDFVGGQTDLHQKVLRAIGDPRLRFAEDKLRMLRAIRFAARLDFEIEHRTFAAIREQAASVAQVSAERIREELTLILTEGAARRGFELLDTSGLLAQVLPELVRMKGVEQPPQYHPEGDVWVHTLMLLAHLPAGSSSTLAWGMLLHDVGKPATFTPPDPAKPGDRIRFNGHVEVGMTIARGILNRLRFSNEDCTQILALVEHHMRFGDILKMRQSTLKRFFRLPQFDEHLALHYADVMSSNGQTGLYEFAKRHREEFSQEEIRPKLLLTGDDLIAAGYRPGPSFKAMLLTAEDAQLEGRVNTTAEALALVRETFENPTSQGSPHDKVRSFPTERTGATNKSVGEHEQGSVDVLIIGAGMAGLTAARALSERGLRVLVIEARDRVGGRVQSIQADGATVELGAEFVHGRPPELWALIDEAEAETVERDGTTLRAASNGRVEEDDPRDDGMFETLEGLRAYEGPDQSFAEFLQTKTMEPQERAALLGYVEGFNAADAERIGILGLGAQQAAEDATEGDRMWHVSGGYLQLAEYLSAKIVDLGGRIHLNEIVRSITWQTGSVRVTTADGQVFVAPQGIVTLPLGVLQQANRGGIEITPEPPSLAAAQRLAMGHVVRFTMIFRHAWWQNAPSKLSNEKLRDLSFLFTPAEVPPVWWTPHPEVGPAALTGWVGGPRSAEIAGRSAEELGAAACQVLAKVFGISLADVQSELVSTHTHDWSADPFALGAYSYVPAGALDASRAMTEPAGNTIFFAGEHTDITGHWGTVHAAVRSGLRAAEQILGEFIA